MENISLPTSISIETSSKESASITIEPCSPGYGLTIGNALRRVLLSSLEGSAVTSIKIDGVDHEFQTIDGVQEDVVEIVMNFKRMNVRSHSSEPVVLKLKTSADGAVTAGDIEENADIKIVDPKHHLFTVTDKKAKIDVEVTITHGRGYETVEVRNEKAPIGTILIDATFSPLRNVSYNTEHVRVGDKTNFDRLVLDIETDGSIDPADALKQAATVLVDQFTFVRDTEVK